MAFVAGAGVSLQAYVNGHLSGRLHSTLVASGVSFLVGAGVLVVAAFATGAVQRARARLRTGHRPRLWHFVGGLCGALLVTVLAYAAPRVGVAVATVGLVAGQTVASLAVDSVGLGPGGRQPATLPRFAGAALAIVAVVLSSLGAGHGDLRLGLLVLVTLTGGAVAIQQATNGRLREVLQDSTVTAAVNFTIGLAVLAICIAVARPSVATLRAPWPYYLGGLFGAAFVLTAAAVVRWLGVLRLSLVAIAGQTAGALVIDVLDPAPGRELGLATVGGAVLTVVAVGVSRL